MHFIALESSRVDPCWNLCATVVVVFGDTVWMVRLTACLMCDRWWTERLYNTQRSTTCARYQFKLSIEIDRKRPSIMKISCFFRQFYCICSFFLMCFFLFLCSAFLSFHSLLFFLFILWWNLNLCLLFISDITFSFAFWYIHRFKYAPKLTYQLSTQRHVH